MQEHGVECEDHHLPFLSKKKNRGMDEGGEEEGRRALNCIYAAYFRPVPHESRAEVYESNSKLTSKADHLTVPPRHHPIRSTTPSRAQI